MSITPLRANTILYCRKWQETVRFYKNQLCLSINFENDWFVEFQLTPTSFVSIASSARASVKDVEGQGITLTLMVEDVQQVKHHLDAQGVKTSPIQKRWGAMVFYCFDPEGHRLEFWADDQQPGEAANG